ncbi:hypothetical protein OSTOST_16719, partial [Ostertagia ostertagi]
MPGVAKPMPPREPIQPKEQTPASPPPAPVSVLPPIGHGVSHTPSVQPTSFNPATLACELRRPPSSDEEENNDADWEDEDAGSQTKAHERPAAVAPTVPSFPAAVETKSHAPASVASIPRYDVVPGDDEIAGGPAPPGLAAQYDVPRGDTKSHAPASVASIPRYDVVPGDDEIAGGPAPPGLAAQYDVPPGDVSST